ncbi:MAG: hypothetical protein ABEH38_04205 [Flavobacteriales bacterium]
MKLHAGSLLFLFLLYPFLQGKGQTQQVLFYNVENLFYPGDDPIRKSDDPYTSHGSKEWHAYRYERKLSGIFKTIAAIGKGRTPIFMGFAELEERRVLEDLVEQTPLKRKRLCIIQYPSPDHRGMDVGAIYRKDRFTPLSITRIRVPLEKKDASPTREMLYVKGKSKRGDTLHFFIAHWPSRWGGRARTEWKRLKAARVLKKRIDSLEDLLKDPSILVMGDLNDTPRDWSIKEVLGAKEWEKGAKGASWYDLMASLPKGSYYHGGKWHFLDHFIVPARMLHPDSSTSYKAVKPQVHSFHWLLREGRGKGKEEEVPHRSFRGDSYVGGISDHLPISVRLKPSQE